MTHTARYYVKLSDSVSVPTLKNQGVRGMCWRGQHSFISSVSNKEGWISSIYNEPHHWSSSFRQGRVVRYISI